MKCYVCFSFMTCNLPATPPPPPPKKNKDKTRKLLLEHESKLIFNIVCPSGCKYAVEKPHLHPCI